MQVMERERSRMGKQTEMAAGRVAHVLVMKEWSSEIFPTHPVLVPPVRATHLGVRH